MHAFDERAGSHAAIAELENRLVSEYTRMCVVACCAGVRRSVS